MNAPEDERPRGIREQWAQMSFYERFEYLIASVLAFVLSIVILIALIRLIRSVTGMLVLEALNPLDYKVFQTIFGMVMTLLIAMEFKHSIVKVIARVESIIQVKTVLLIAMLVVARKFILIDPEEIAPANLAGLAFALLAIGVVYWLMRERDDRGTT